MAPFLNKFEYLKIKLEDIKTATGDFDENKVIGGGGFGKVYRGEVSHSKGKIMGAFKRLDPKEGQGDFEFKKEIRLLSNYKHPNIISLLGYCDEGREKILVYEYASNGSLDRHLRSTNLSWRQRIKICLDAARGISFLHDDKGTMQRVIHRDIKSSNILLDDNWNAKVSDMGLCKIGPANLPRSYIIDRVAGTPGYMDPEYGHSYTLTKESDIYSLGVVLFEVLCGKLCCKYSNGKIDQFFVPTWKKAYIEKKLHDIVFQNLTQPMDPTSLKTFSDIAFQCLQDSRGDRPTIAHVVEKLETALKSVPPPPPPTHRTTDPFPPRPPPPPPPPTHRTVALFPPRPPPPPPPPTHRTVAPFPPRPPPPPPPTHRTAAPSPPRPPPPPPLPPSVRAPVSPGLSQISNLKPLDWSKVTRALQGSLWEELQRPGEPRSALDFDMTELEEFLR